MPQGPVPACSTGFGLPRHLRLRRTRDYRRVQDRGQRVREPHLLAVVLPGRERESRVGITVSRKVGNAVVRNRVKRWLREAIRHERQRLGPSTGPPSTGRTEHRGTWDVVLIAHPNAATSSAAAIRRDVASAFTRIGRGRGGR